MSAPDDAWPVFWRSFVVTALNPKSIVFFVAFTPQFLDPSAPPFLQSAILVVTFVALAAANVVLWVIAAASLRARMRNPSVLINVRRAGATLMVGAGLATALARRAG